MDIIEILAHVEDMKQQGRRDRQHSQMTLGSLISALEGFQADRRVVFDQGPDAPCNPHSYRGYYDDLALEPEPCRVTVGDLLRVLSGCEGEAYEGYKGGDYVMNCNTPMWCASYSCCGRKIVDCVQSGDQISIVTADRD